MRSNTIWVTRASAAGSCMSLVCASLLIGMPSASKAETNSEISKFMSEAPVGRKALVVGVRQYKALPEVPSAELDATSFAKKLEELGFQVTLSINDNSQELWKKLRGFENGLEPNEVAVVYYSGHGFQNGGLNFLTAADTPQLITDDDLLYKTVPLNDIIERVKSARAAFSVLIIDACRDNQVVIRLPDGKSKGVGSSGIGEPKRMPTEVVMGFATGFGQVARSSDSPSENSIYTSSLLKHFEREDLEISRLLQDVGVDVAAKRADQVPEMRNISAGNFYPRPGLVAKTSERTTWQNALNQNRADVLQFLLYWPAGFYAKAAREWLEVNSTQSDSAKTAQSITTNIKITNKSALPDEWTGVRSVERLMTKNLIASALPKSAGGTANILGGASLTTKDLAAYTEANAKVRLASVLPQNTLVNVVNPCVEANGSGCLTEVSVDTGSGKARRLFVEGAYEISALETQVSGSNSGNTLRSSIKLLPMLDSDVENDTVRVHSMEFVSQTNGKEKKSAPGFGAGLTLNQVAGPFAKVTDNSEEKMRVLMKNAIANVSMTTGAAPVSAYGERDRSPALESKRYLRALQIRNQLEAAGVARENIVVKVLAADEDGGTAGSLDKIVITLPR